MWMERRMLHGIDWPSVFAQAVQTGGALLMVIVAWTLPRAVWRGALWWFNSGKDRGAAERAALARLLNEAEERGFNRGWSAAEKALSTRAARTSGPTSVTV
ncbi:hypothetical protein GXW78_06025 [Roseomonas terrae]|uniref:Uncharacterized protein n=1 Tax=Neoroseomonas terrae TaxID=424799 RepID=A0ABS5EDX2_9PROT|nr:hypothetical protein [Neoroseomonas terrae]MBR0649211.1 hypothetical protein [Neoroseomonas terrae]